MPFRPMHAARLPVLGLVQWTGGAARSSCHASVAAEGMGTVRAQQAGRGWRRAHLEADDDKGDRRVAVPGHGVVDAGVAADVPREGDAEYEREQHRTVEADLHQPRRQLERVVPVRRGGGTSLQESGLTLAQHGGTRRGSSLQLHFAIHHALPAPGPVLLVEAPLALGMCKALPLTSSSLRAAETDSGVAAA